MNFKSDINYKITLYCQFKLFFDENYLKNVQI